MMPRPRGEAPVPNDRAKSQNAFAAMAIKSFFGSEELPPSQDVAQTLNGLELERQMVGWLGQLSAAGMEGSSEHLKNIADDALRLASPDLFGVDWPDNEVDRMKLRLQAHPRDIRTAVGALFGAIRARELGGSAEHPDAELLKAIADAKEAYEDLRDELGAKAPETRQAHADWRAAEKKWQDALDRREKDPSARPSSPGRQSDEELMAGLAKSVDRLLGLDKQEEDQ